MGQSVRAKSTATRSREAHHRSHGTAMRKSVDFVDVLRVAKPMGTIGTPPKTNMTMENRPFEDVFPVENGIFQSHVSFSRV